MAANVCSNVQVIDLDMLDKVGSAKGVEELRVQLKQQVDYNTALPRNPTVITHKAYQISRKVTVSVHVLSLLQCVTSVLD